MKYIDWDAKKNEKLKKERSISFEEIRTALETGHLLDIITHPNKKMYVVIIDNYAYLVPFVEDEKKYFLKTIIPSRKMTKKYLQGGDEK